MADVSIVAGETRFLHIWAQPQTQGSGPFDPVLNPFRTLQNFSLNLETSGSAVLDFLDGSITVHNPEFLTPGYAASAKRFQFVGDASSMIGSEKTASDVAGGALDSIRRLQGFSIEFEEVDAGKVTEFAGIGEGSTCLAGDPFCALTPDDSPAWLLASVEVAAVGPGGSGEVFLQVGPVGINHQGESSSQTAVTFGSPSDPVYNAAEDRGIKLPGDSVDALTPTIAMASVAGWQGGDGDWATDNWQLGGPEPWPSWAIDAVLSTSDTVTVFADQQANSTLVQDGRLMIEAGATLASDMVVESSGSLGGGGVVSGHLALDGELEIGESPTGLLVMGAASLAGAELTLADSYTQPPDTVSEPFSILTAALGVTGSFATPLGADIGRGFQLETLEHTDAEVIVSIRSPAAVVGDFDGNGIVGLEDFLIWREDYGLSSSAADGNGDGVVDAADFTLWRDHLPAAGNYDGTVPEPSTSGVVYAALSTALVARKRLRARLPGSL
ncbi:MAG: hypothetical protein AAGJ46_08675 [Planctomycetota bacterium]